MTSAQAASGPPFVPPAARPASGGVSSFLKLVAIEHSVFALPFAYLAVFAASRSDGGGVHWKALGLVTVAMVAARTFAMAANRIVDRELDARNPRTAGRELVTGAVPVRTAVIGSVVSLVVFFAVAAVLSPLCLALSPIALALLVVYPYGKRFTWACHGLLGLAQAVAPVGAWLATTGHWSWTSVLLGLAVGTWIGGFDLIYALQDYEHDRTHGVYSFPARFGIVAALRASTVTHVVTFGLLVWYGLRVDAGPWWYAGLAVTAVGFVYEHAIVHPHDLSRVNRAFFTANGVIGIVLLVFGLFDLMARGLNV